MVLFFGRTRKTSIWRPEKDDQVARIGVEENVFFLMMSSLNSKYSAKPSGLPNVSEITSWHNKIHLACLNFQFLGNNFKQKPLMLLQITCCHHDFWLLIQPSIFLGYFVTYTQQITLRCIDVGKGKAVLQHQLCIWQMHRQSFLGTFFGIFFWHLRNPNLKPKPRMWRPAIELARRAKLELQKQMWSSGSVENISKIILEGVKGKTR